MASIRLICPNCGATYEIDARAIPHDGRDVQCSNCAHVWFEAPSDTAEDELPYSAPSTFDAADPDLDYRDPDPARPEPAGMDARDADPMDADDAFDDDDLDDFDEPDDAPDEPTEPRPSYAEMAFATPAEAAATTRPSESPGALPRRPLDSSIADILREEAAREEAVRQAEAGQSAPLETQTDLPLDPAPAPTPADRELPDRLATLRGLAPADPVAPPRERRDQFPDIDEINSSLRSQSDRDFGGPISADDEDEKGGFALGLILSIGVILLLLVIYLLAEPLSGAFPDLAGPLGSYAGAIDRLRLALDSSVRSLAQAVSGG